MSNTARIAATAANTLTTPLNIEDVFSTYVYDGTSATQTITNGIDLAGEGGLVWIKSRTSTTTAFIFDTERGATKSLTPSETGAQETDVNTLTAFNSNGFSVGSSGKVNSSLNDYASWTFRKAPKFFDVVTWTGDGATVRNISHNLGCTVGMLVVKATSSATYPDWHVFHRSNQGDHSAPEDTRLALNTTASYTTGTTGAWGETLPTDTVFTVGGAVTNESGVTYVAYLFAHNDGDGNFGPNGNADIIKCGSYTGTGSAADIDVGFEPQWLLVKKASALGNWFILDNMRGFTTGGVDARLFPNTSSAENSTEDWVDITPTGFRTKITDTYSSGDYIYIAIRRGPMAVPESATDVFAMDTLGGTLPNPPAFNSDFPVDMGIYRLRTSTSNFIVNSRLNQGKRLMTNATDAESAESAAQFDYMNGYYDSTSVSSDYIDWMWKRAPSFFDIVCYDGTGTTQTLSHNLGVAPEMIWVKSRSHATDWIVYDKEVDMTQTYQLLKLNDLGARSQNVDMFGSTHPTSSSFTIGSTNTRVNGSGRTYIAYLFASLDGVSKVGSYTGNSSTQNIDCGFSSGARFVLIKRTDSTGDWHVWDTERGIVAGFDPYLELNTTNAQSSGATAGDYIDPLSSGFALTSNSLANASGGTYIFYAIA